jgi:hypothetical protein
VAEWFRVTGHETCVRRASLAMMTAPLSVGVSMSTVWATDGRLSRSWVGRVPPVLRPW